MKRQKGFTLVELIIVMAIIAILSMLITPSIIRYINRSRKSNDVAIAEAVCKSCQLAMASSDDDVARGWDVCTEVPGYGGSCAATPTGYRYMGTVANGSALNLQGYYGMKPVAWCRGIKYKNYENSYFKSTLDDDSPNAPPEKQYGRMQREFTDEMLHCFLQDRAKGGTISNRQLYDGKEGLDVFGFNFNKPILCSDGVKRKPECWIIYRRDDTGQPEVWIGYKQGSIQPICRVFPNTCKDYSQ